MADGMVIPTRDTIGWEDFFRLADEVDLGFAGHYTQQHFDYVFPKRLQRHWPIRQRKDTPIRVSYTEWGDPGKPLVVCLGGIANTARRFDYIAEALRPNFHVVCMDWIGRGSSGWMPREADYALSTHVDQVRALLVHLKRRRMTLIGSSLGGIIGMMLASARPGCLERLVLNDVGPFLPSKRRRRRAQAVARHYVFHTPADLFRRSGAAAKNDGPISDAELIHNVSHQIRWSEQDGGCVYRHDPRALQAYAADATHSLMLWKEWATITCPVLLTHGLLSDALLEPTIRRMQRHRRDMPIIRVPRTGHTPSLSSPPLIGLIHDWLLGGGPEGETTCLDGPAPERRLFR